MRNWLRTYSTGKVWVGILLVVTWCIMARFFLVAQPKIDNYNQDFYGHLQYTTIIQTEHRLPSPNDGFETYHPPLYYLIASWLPDAPSDSHIIAVKTLSVVYGAIFLICIYWFLLKLKVRTVIAVLVSAVISTTPSFVFLFTTYNNDALVTALMGIAACFAFAYWVRPRYWLLIVLFFATMLGVYTKYSFLLFGGVFLATVIVGMIVAPATRKQLLTLAITLIIGSTTLTPWLFFHNKPETGKLFPNNFASLTTQLVLPTTWSAFVLHDPFEANQFATPYIYRAQGLFNLQKTSYSAYVYSTALYGEYSYGLDITWLVWAMVWLSLLAFVIGVIANLWTGKGRMALFVFFAGISSSIAYVWFSPFSPSSNFRYIAWLFLPLAVMAAFILDYSTESLENRANWLSWKIIPAGLTLILAFLLLANHLYFLDQISLLLKS